MNILCSAPSSLSSERERLSARIVLLMLNVVVVVDGVHIVYMFVLELGDIDIDCWCLCSKKSVTHPERTRKEGGSLCMVWSHMLGGQQTFLASVNLKRYLHSAPAISHTVMECVWVPGVNYCGERRHSYDDTETEFHCITSSAAATKRLVICIIQIYFCESWRVHIRSRHFAATLIINCAQYFISLAWKTKPF